MDWYVLIEHDVFQEVTPMLARLEGCNILVVDDDLDSLILLKTFLELEGAIVVVADSAIAALNTLEQFQPDLLLCDIAMPSMDGYALIKQLRHHTLPQWSHLPAIAMTAMSGTCEPQRSIDAGFQLHLEKPIDLDQLIEAIQMSISRTAPYYTAPPVDDWSNLWRFVSCLLPLSA